MKRKILAFLVVCALILPAVNKIPVPKAAETLIYDDFETDLNGWGPRGEDEIVELSTEEAYSGKQSVKVTNRTETWNGPMCDKTDELEFGVTYNFSIYVKYVGNSYSNTQNFSLQLQYNDGVDDRYMNIKTAPVYKGQWTLLQGEYTVPTDATDVHIYVETEFKNSPSSQDLMDFYIDDFKAVPATLPEIETDIPSLKDVFSDYFLVGGASTVPELGPAPAKELILKHYNCLTFGNELKPDAVLDYDATIAYMEANDGDQVNPQVNLRAARALFEFAQKYNIPVRGHTLVWHNQTPDWFFRENYSQDSSAPWASKEVMLQRLENYIKNVMNLIEETYPDVEIYAWDVVNEAVDPNTSTGMRNPGSNNVTSGNSLWMQTVGKDFIEKAFEYARKYAPAGCKLFYNDYNEYEDRKSDLIYDILANLKSKNLIDGMGMQSHWTMEYPSINMFETAVRKYNKLGLEIHLTEIDMRQPNNDSYSLNAQAARYKTFINKAVELKKEGMNITAIIFWGVTDKTSWLGGYPLLFDGDYKAKPAFYSIIEDYKDGTPTITPTPLVTPTPTPLVTPTPTPSVTPAPGDARPVVTVKTSNSGNTVSQNYTLTAEGGTIDLSKVKIVFTADGMSNEEQNLWCDHAALQLNTNPFYVPLTDKTKGEITNQSLILTIDSNTTLEAGQGKFVADVRFAKKDWSSYDTLTNPIVKVYYDGQLVQ
jgi:endo-1,4-beta-xylanase